MTGHKYCGLIRQISYDNMQLRHDVFCAYNDFDSLSHPSKTCNSLSLFENI